METTVTQEIADLKAQLAGLEEANASYATAYSDLNKSYRSLKAEMAANETAWRERLVQASLLPEAGPWTKHCLRHPRLAASLEVVAGSIGVFMDEKLVGPHLVTQLLDIAEQVGEMLRERGED